MGLHDREDLGSSLSGQPFSGRGGAGRRDDLVAGERVWNGKKAGGREPGEGGRR